MERFSLKPSRWEVRSCLSSITGFSLFNRIFSNSFVVVGRREIGLYEAVSFKGLPGFGIMITSDTFHCLGTYLILNSALITYRSFLVAFSDSCFNS